MQGIQPSPLLDRSLQISYGDGSSALSYTEQLYTPRGSQGIGTSTGSVADGNVDPHQFNSTLLMVNNDAAKENLYYKQRVIFSLREEPDWASDSGGDYMLVNLPNFCYWSERDMDETHYKYLLIKMKDSKDHELIDEIGKALEKVVGTGVKVQITYKEVSSNDEVTNIVNYIFYLTIAIMMFLCFFSLTASMSANLYE